MTRFYKVLLALLCISSGLFSQVILKVTLRGTDQQALALGVVILESEKGNSRVKLITDSLGQVTFRNCKKASYQASAFYTGYTHYESQLHLANDTTLNVVLKPAQRQLRSITVTANKAAIDNDAEKLTYNVSNNILAIGNDVLAVIGKIPGVRVSGDEIGIVGKGAVRVMLNGQVIQLAGSDLLRYLKSMSANQISKIEVIKNPPANYDADGNAGLINITTKRSLKQGFSGNIQSSDKKWLHQPAAVYEIHNFWEASLSSNLNYYAEKWSVFMNLNTDQDHELEGFETDVFYPHSASLQTDTGDYRYHNFNAITGMDYKLSNKVSLGLSYSAGRNIYKGSDHVNNPFYSAFGQLDSLQRTYATYEPVALSNSLNTHAVINLDTSGRKLLLNADYFNYYRTDHSDFESNSFLANAMVLPGERTRYYDNNKQAIQIYTLKADIEIPTKFARLSFGGKLSFINTYSNAYYFDKSPQAVLTYDTRLSNEFSYKENTQSLYADVTNEKARWKYNAGLRMEYTQTKAYSYTTSQTNRSNYLKLFPSLLLTYQADSSNSFSLTLGRRINRPTFWMLNPFKSLYTAYSLSEGNPFLQPEFNYNLELSHTYKNKITSGLFVNSTQNGFGNVTFASLGSNLVTTYPVNFIQTLRIGLSESFTTHPFSWLDNTLQFTFYHTRANSDLVNVKSIQGFGKYLALSNTIYLNSSKTLGAALNGWYQWPEIDHAGRSAAYYKLDLGISATTLKKKLLFALAFNDAYRSSATSVTTTANSVNTRFTNFQLNRFLLVTISYHFGGDSLQKSQTGNEDEKSRAH